VVGEQEAQSNENTWEVFLEFCKANRNSSGRRSGTSKDTTYVKIVWGFLNTNRNKFGKIVGNFNRNKR
jgi:hypothetical protein